MNGKNRKIYIRADGNRILGLGHIMRCCSIAEALQRKNVTCKFIVADQCSADIVLECGFDAVQLDSEWKNPEEEINRVLEVVEEEKIQVLLIDSYYVTENYLKTLRRYTRVAYLTGMKQFYYPVDMLINYHIYAEHMGYEKEYGSDTKLILGIDYVPLRKEFSMIRAYHAEQQAILITTGGTDPFHIVPDLLGGFLKGKSRNWKFYIIIGKYYDEREIEQLKKIQKKNQNIILCRNVKNMKQLMEQCSGAVSAGGSTLYELCACGIPTITFAFADNQLRPIMEFAKKKVMVSAGDIRIQGDRYIASMVKKAEDYLMDHEWCTKISKKMRTMVDGKGADRLAQILIEHCR